MLIAVGVNLVVVRSQCFCQFSNTCATQMMIALTADWMFVESTFLVEICFPWDFDGHRITAKAMHNMTASKKRHQMIGFIPQAALRLVKVSTGCSDTVW